MILTTPWITTCLQQSSVVKIIGPTTSKHNEAASIMPQECMLLSACSKFLKLFKIILSLQTANFGKRCVDVFVTHHYPFQDFINSTYRQFPSFSRWILRKRVEKKRNVFHIYWKEWGLIKVDESRSRQLKWKTSYQVPSSLSCSNFNQIFA